MKVLFLTPWYPSEKDEMAGLFVQKHADAVRAQGVDVRVLHSQSWRDMWQQWRKLKREWGLPDVTQLNVIQKQGTLARWLKRRYGIPYVIVEHWSGYLPENGTFRRMPAVKQRFFRRTAAQAEALLTVSPSLQQAMEACGITAKRTGRLHNVVDEFFYEDGQKASALKDKRQKTLLHISCFDERAKNTFALLRGFKALCDRRQDIELVMVGTGVDIEASHRVADEAGIPSNCITWTGEQTPRQVCEWLHRADALVLTSRYETYGVVLAEAAATGTPILSTPVGIATETVNEHTGILIPQENAKHPKRLSEYMERIITMPKYASRGEAFRAETIGKQLKELYDSCLHSDI